MAAACAVARQSQAADAGWIARNPTGNRYEQVPLRMGLPMPAGDFAVTADGQNVPFQVEKTTTGRVIWVAATVPPGGTVTYKTRSAKPQEAAKTVRVVHVDPC